MTSYPIQQAYNDASMPTTTTYPDGENVTSTYTPQGWLAGETTSQNGVTTTLLSNASYTGAGGAGGAMTGAQLGNGTYTYSATFDALLRPTDTKLTRTSDSTTRFEQARGYDAVGNVTAATTTLPAGTDNQAFCYDEQNRLIWSGSTGTPSCGSTLTSGTLTSAQYTASYGYDTLDRLTSAPAGSYTYGDSAHLHAVTAIGSSGSTAYSASYDPAGNMTCRAPTSSTTCSGTPTGAQLSYDNEGRLASWQQSGTTISYLYDGEGNRVQQQVASGNPSVTTYIGNVEEVTSAGGATVTTTYYYANGQRIALAINGSFSYLASDGLGSATVALDANGNAQASVLYGPYGANSFAGYLSTGHYDLAPPVAVAMSSSE